MTGMNPDDAKITMFQKDLREVAELSASILTTRFLTAAPSPMIFCRPRLLRHFGFLDLVHHAVALRDRVLRELRRRVL